MNVCIYPGALSGSVSAIASKSEAHRELICCALADAETLLEIGELNRDIEATMQCLTAIGAGLERVGNTLWRIKPVDLNERIDMALLDCGESGSTLRFFLPIAAVLCKRARFIGHGRLPQRPLNPLPEQMQKKGCAFSSKQLPLEVSGSLEAGEYHMPGDVSSQYISGLLFALPLLKGDSRIMLDSPLQSVGYVDMTISALNAFGISIETLPNGEGYAISGNQRYISPGRLTVGGDWSNMGVFLAAGAIAKPVTVRGLCAESCQGDREILSVLKDMGAKITVEDEAVKAQGNGLLPIIADVSQTPDLVPVIAVLALAAKGESRIINAARLRIKESDRLLSVSQMIKALGGEVIEKQDSLIINGTGRLLGGVTESFNDHRIVMAAALASLICEQSVVIKDAEAVGKSYTRFFEDFKQLGGKCDVI